MKSSQWSGLTAKWIWITDNSCHTSTTKCGCQYVLQRACLASQTHTSRYMCPGSTPHHRWKQTTQHSTHTTAHPHTHLLLNVINGEQVHSLHQIKLGHHSSHVIRFSQFDTDAIKSYRQRKEKSVCVAIVFGSSDLH